MNFIKTSKDVMLEYGIAITTELQLPDGEYVKHFESADPIWLAMRTDERVEYLTGEEVNALKPVEEV